MLNPRKVLGALKAGRVEFDLMVGLCIKGSGAVASFGLTLLVSRLYGPDGVGTFQIAVTTAAMLAVASMFGLDNVLIRSVSVAWHRNDLGTAHASILRALRVALRLGLGLMVAMAVLSLPLTYFIMGEPEVYPAMLILSMAVPALALTRLLSGSIRCTGRIFLAQSLDGISYTGITFIGLGLAWITFGRPPALLPEALYAVACLCVAYFGWHKLSAMIRDWPLGQHSLSLRSGARIASISLMGLSVDWLAMITLGSWEGPGEAGIYRVAAQFGLLFVLVRNSFDQMIGPHVAARYALVDHAGMLHILRRSCLIGGGLCLPMLGALLLFPEVLLGFFGTEFAHGKYALMILAFGQFVGVAAGPVGSTLDMCHREHLAMRIEAGVTVVTVGLLVLLVPAYGITGAAIATASATVIRSGCLWLAALHVIRGMRRERPA